MLTLKKTNLSLNNYNLNMTMTSMMDTPLNHLVGTWLSEDGEAFMWIGLDKNLVEICINKTVILSEVINFIYDEKNNICILSESVVLYQLLGEDEILVRISMINDKRYLTLKKRTL